MGRQGYFIKPRLRENLKIRRIDAVAAIITVLIPVPRKQGGEIMRFFGLSILAVAVVVSPAMAQANGNTAMMDQTAVAFVKAIFANWSKPNAIALPYFDYAYAKKVNFYGGMITHAAVMKNERNFADRWQIRDYTLKAISSVTCHVESATCTVNGVVHWNAEAPGPKLHSEGNATFSYKVLLANDHPLIEAQSGSVLRRKSEKIMSTYGESNKIDASKKTEIRYDYEAQNLAYKAFDGDSAALKSLKTKSKNNPAFVWGMYEYYKLKRLKLNLPSTETIIIDKTIDPILEESDGRFNSNMRDIKNYNKSIMTPNQIIAHNLSKNMIRYLIKAAKEGDPAAEGSEAKEIWSEVARQFPIVASMFSNSRAPTKYNILSFESSDNGKPFSGYQTVCSKGFNLALASKSAGWPGSYLPLVFYSAPLGDNMAGRLGVDAGCGGRSVPGYKPGMAGVRALMAEGAEAGSVALIEGRIIDTLNDKAAQNRWINELKTRAASGDQKAKHMLSELPSVLKIAKAQAMHSTK